MSDLYTGSINKMDQKKELKHKEQGLQKKESLEKEKNEASASQVEGTKNKEVNSPSVMDQINIMMPKQIGARTIIKKPSSKAHVIYSNKKLQALPKVGNWVLPTEDMLNESVTRYKSYFDRAELKYQQTKTDIEVFESTIAQFEKDLERIVALVPAGEASNSAVSQLMNVIVDLQAKKKQREEDLPNFEEARAKAKGEYDTLVEMVAKTAQVPEALDLLTEKSKTILDSNNQEEKKNFLKDFSDMKSYYEVFEMRYRISNFGQVTSYIAALKNALDNMAYTASQVAAEFVNEQALQEDYKVAAKDEAEIAEMEETLKAIQNKKALTAQYVQILEEKVNKKAAKKAQKGQDSLAGFSEEERKQIEDFKAEVSKMKGDSLNMFLSSYRMVLDECINLEVARQKELDKAQERIDKKQIALGVIQMCKTVPAEVEDILANKAKILEETTLEEKYSYIEKIIRLYDLKKFKGKDKDNPTPDEQTVRLIAYYLDTKTPQLSELAEDLSAQIFEINNEQMQYVKYDEKKILKILTNKKDMKAMAETIMRLRTYNTDYNNMEKAIKALYDRAEDIVNLEAGFTQQQSAALGLAIVEMRNKYKLQYYENERSLEQALPKSITGVHRRRLAQYLNYLSETQYFITQCDELNGMFNQTEQSLDTASENVDGGAGFVDKISKVDDAVNGAHELAKIFDWGNRVNNNKMVDVINKLNNMAIRKSVALQLI